MLDFCIPRVITFLSIVTMGTDTVITSVGWVVQRRSACITLGVLLSVRVSLPRYAFSSKSSNVLSLYFTIDVRLTSVIAASSFSGGSGVAPVGLGIINKGSSHVLKDLSTKGKAIDSARTNLAGAYGNTPNSVHQPRS